MRRSVASRGAAVKLRIEALPGEVDAVAALLRGVLEVVEESRDYANRPPSRQVRRYLEVRAPAEPGKTGR